MYIFLLAISIFICSGPNAQDNKDIITDSAMTFEEAVRGSGAPDSIIANLRLIDVDYFSLDGKLHRGQLVVHKDAVKDIREIFDYIKETKFPIARAIPISKYKWSDAASMKDNNTSSFCFRKVSGTPRLSKHALGKAIDINPFFNPVVYPNGRISPSGAKYQTYRPGTFYTEHPLVQKFIALGWRWGGKWRNMHDNHHFDMGKR